MHSVYQLGVQTLAPNLTCNLCVISQARPQRSQRCHWADFAGAVPHTPTPGTQPGTSVSKGSCTKAWAAACPRSQDGHPCLRACLSGPSSGAAVKISLLGGGGDSLRQLCSDSVPSALKFLGLPQAASHASPRSKKHIQAFIWGCLSSEMT